MRRAVLARGCAALLLLPGMPGAEAAPLRLLAPAFDGQVRHEMLEVVLEGSRIAHAGPPAQTGAAALPEERFEAPHFLTPGLIDLDARFGLQGDAEPFEILAVDLLLADAFAPDEDEAAALRRSGVTTAWLLGGDSVVIAGAGAVVQPTAAGEPAMLRARWGCSASLASAARVPERAPTSLPDQAQALELLAGEIAGPLRVRFDDGASARHAARLGIPVGLPLLEGDVTELAQASKFIASTDWASVGSRAISLTTRRLGSGDGGTVGLGSGDSVMGPVAVRLAAARLLEAGADRDALLRALTSDAARLLGDPERGRIAAGAVADLVLWSGDPVLPGSRPLRVWVAGEEIFRAP